jgi:uncharacterized protein
MWDGEVALRWLESRRMDDRALFCRFTQQSYLRLLTVAEWMGADVCSNGRAIKAYQKLLTDPRIDLLDEEPSGLEAQWLEFAASTRPSPKLWMDAYLAAFALCGQLAFVTFDRGFKQFPGLEIHILQNSGRG